MPRNSQSTKISTLAFAGLVSLSTLVMGGAIALLVYMGGIWNFLANTRLLDLFVKSGVIQYHDRTQGITWIPDVKYYLNSQDPVQWGVLFGVLLLYLGVFTLKSFQFKGIMRFVGIPLSTTASLRTFSGSLLWRNIAPFRLGGLFTELSAQNRGAGVDRARTAAFLTTCFGLLEILFFALIGAFILGWSAWVGHIFWAIAITVLAAILVRPTVNASDEGTILTRFKKTLVQTIQALLAQPGFALWLGIFSIVAFSLRDLSAYFVTQAFSGTNVFLHVSPETILMGVVAYHMARIVRFTPGGIGQGEWAMAAALWVGGTGFPECATIAILHTVVRLVAIFVFRIATSRWSDPHHDVNYETLYDAFLGRKEPVQDDRAGQIAVDATAPLKKLGSSTCPDPSNVWVRSSLVLAIAVGLYYLDRSTFLMMDFWLLEKLGYASVFWTNFGMGAKLLIFGGLAMAAGIAAPAFLNPLTAAQRKIVVIWAVILGSLGGFLLSGTYHDFLPFGGDPAGKTDPVFGRDITFYLYYLDGYWRIWAAAFYGSLFGLISAILCAFWAARNQQAEIAASLKKNRVRTTILAFFNKITIGPLATLGVVLAIGEYLSRYDLLLQYDKKHVIKVGATYIDVVGFFSNLNYTYLTAFVILVITGVLAMYIKNLNDAAAGDQDKLVTLPKLRNLVVLLLLVDFGFKGLVGVRNWISVKPNEPVIQLEYIQRHIDATREAYNFDAVQEIDFMPAGPGDPMPTIDELLAHPTVQNTQLWPGFTSYLEGQLDPQHSLRILQTKGDKMVYGPTLEIFYQQQKLRAYYNFLGIDAARYTLNGEKKILISSIREVPLVEPQPWLAWWGQQYMLYTHGHGLVMAEAGKSTPEGEPVYATYGIPMTSAYDELLPENPRIYYGEGAGTIAYTNVDQMKELDYPTEQGRAELWLPEGFGTGVKMDSIWKRLAFGWRTGQLAEVVFSGIIKDETQVHYFRTPIERLERIAPFLYYDNGTVHAAVADKKTLWFVNGLATSKDYPYAMYGNLGDKSDERAAYPRPWRKINYVEDAVKATIDAASGEVRFYKMGSHPLIDNWARIYPDLFVDAEEMPEPVRAQITYPVQLFHLQFDDLYIYYHMNDPMYFFNMEDMFDDADEVLGPMMDSGHAIRFSMEPQNILLDTSKGVVPDSDDNLQYALTMPYTSQSAYGLRALPIAYQDGADYGKLSILMVPKGHYAVSPEQADAMIDQNPEISRHFSWWTRMGSEVIRGHTSTLLVGNEIIYVEPIYIRSQQVGMTQLKRVAAVFRGHARMGHTLEEALRLAVEAYQRSLEIQPPVTPHLNAELESTEAPL